MQRLSFPQLARALPGGQRNKLHIKNVLQKFFNKRDRDPEKRIFQTSPTQLALLGNLLRSRLDFIHNFLWQRVYPIVHCIFALSQCPANKVLENLGFVWVWISSQKPGVGDNG